MKTILALIFYLMLPLSIFSQYYDVLINPYWNFYSDNHLDAVSSGMGRTGIGSVGDISSSQINPAAFEMDTKYQISFNYTYRTNQEWLISLGLNDIYLKQNEFSGSAGIGYKINKNFNAGIMYSNPYSFNLDAGEVIMTNEFGQEIGRYEAIEKFKNHNFSVPLTYRINNFKLGLSLNYTMNRRKSEFGSGDYIVKYNRFNIAAGILAEPVNGLTIGIMFVPLSEGKSDIETTIQPIIDEYTNIVLPMQIGTGISYTIPQNKLKLAADYKFIQGSKLDGQVDQHLFNFGIQYPLNKYWVIRGGFFNTYDPRDLNSNYGNKSESFDQLFITAGATVKADIAGFTLAIMDSHISSATLKYTFITAGLNINF